MTLATSAKLTETLVWEGVTIQVRYDPDWSSLSELGSDRQVAHLAIQAVDPKDAPLPITEGGYRSHFLDPGVVERAGGPVAFVDDWLDQGAGKPAWRRAEAARRQLDLFG